MQTAAERERFGGARGGARRLLCAVAAVLGVFATGSAAAQTPGGEQRTYPVSAFVLEYALPHPANPPLEELRSIELEMRVTRGGLMQPHPSTYNIRFPLGEVPPDTRIWTSGLQYVNRQILEAFRRRGIGGVLITLPDLEEGTGNDLRPPGETALRVLIWTGRVENISTIADGDRFAGSPRERTNRPEHRFVREGSPVTAGGEGGLLRIDEIEEYAERLSRHPGRRVDAKLRPGENPGTTRIEYHVAEHKPWLAYASLANNGTRATGRRRERFGLSHNQLSGNDDVLRLDYVTADFDEVHGVFASYEGPVWREPRLRWRLASSFSQYDASELGVNRLDFSGDEWDAGGRLVANVFQRGAFFADVFGGVRWRHVAIDNEFVLAGFPTIGKAGQEDFFLPEAGVALAYDGFAARLDFEAGWERNLQGLAGTHTANLVTLGRADPDPGFQLLHWGGRLSVYLESILYRGRGWEDPAARSRATLAHELVISTRGQWSLGNRLIPQFQQVVGGLYTVRGYEQSIAAGDSAAIGSVEYRLHLARLLDPGAEPVEVPVLGPVQLRPTHVFARPDWDLVLHAFYDAGRTFVTDRQPGLEKNNETLAGWGVGAELQFLRYLRASLDVAWPRRRLSDGSRGSRNPELHGVVTVMF